MKATSWQCGQRAHRPVGGASGGGGAELGSWTFTRLDFGGPGGGGAELGSWISTRLDLGRAGASFLLISRT